MNTLKINLIRRSILFLGLLCFLPFVLPAQNMVPTGTYPNDTDTLGRKQGAWKKLDEQGTCIYVGQFKDDKPYGIFKYFDTDGRVMSEMNFLKGGPVAYGKMYGVSGKLQAQGKYINQLKDSTWLFYTEEGLLLSSENYVKGKKEGKSVTYHPGTKQIAEEKTFKNGLEEGPWVQYYYDGKKEAEGTYVAGNFEGKAVWYCPDGKINIIGNYQHAVKHGIWVYYNCDDGKEKGRETWRFGKLTSQEQLVKPEDLNKSIEDPQDPNHDAGSGTEPGGQ